MIRKLAKTIPLKTYLVLITVLISLIFTIAAGAYEPHERVLAPDSDFTWESIEDEYMIKGFTNDEKGNIDTDKSAEDYVNTAGNEVVHFPDSNLEQAIRDTLNKLTGEITKIDVEGKTNPVPLVIVYLEDPREFASIMNEGLDIIEADYINKEITVVKHEYEKNYLTSNNFEYDILVKDLNKRTDFKSIQKHAEERTDYRTFQEYQKELNEMELLHPEIAKLHVIGYSVEGRPIYALEISTAPGKEDGRPESVHTAMHHAREWPSGEIAMELAWHLLENYGHCQQVTSIVNDIRTWIIPMANPDGFIYSQNEYQMWRKNRRINGDGTFGVDLNRNYSYYWGGDGSSGNTNSAIYRGMEPFSEPESQAIRDFYLDRQVITSVSGHTFGELILYPWGYKDEPIHDPQLSLMAADMSEWNDYTHGPTVSTIYQVSGDKIDWIYGIFRGLAFTYEYGKSFIPPYEGYHYPALITNKLGTIEGRIFTYSVSPNDLEGEIIDCGPGTVPEDFPLELEGNIALIERGGISLRNKAINAATAGAAAVIFYNNVDGILSGTLGGDGIDIPVLGISRADGLSILDKLYKEEMVSGKISEGIIHKDSYAQLFEKNLPSLLYCIEKAKDYAVIIEGNVIDKISGEQIEAQLEITIDRKAPLAGHDNEFIEVHKNQIDVFGNYQWYILPGKQPEIDVGPYNISVSSAGRESKTVKLTIDDYVQLHQLDFQLRPKYNVELNTYPTNAGNIYSEGKHYDGELLTLTATPADGWQFEKWIVNDTEYNTSTITVTMDTDKTAAVFFIEEEIDEEEGWEIITGPADPVVLDKPWLITFSRSFSVNEIDGIVIERNNEFVPVRVELKPEDKQVIVTPVEDYYPNAQYNLRIFLNNLNRYKMYFNTVNN